MEIKDKVQWEDPKRIVGEVIAVIPTHEHRAAYVMNFLDREHDNVELRLGSTCIYGEQSYLIRVTTGCKNCHDKVYHIPESALTKIP